MDILILQVFVSLTLVVGSVILFGVTCRARSFEHSDRLALLPLDETTETDRKTLVKDSHGSH